VDFTSHVEAEIASQKECWERAVELAPSVRTALPSDGERVAAIGCGTSWFIVQAYAALREGAGQGETHAFAASELPAGRHYDRVLAISRSGTTTEVVQALEQFTGTPTVVVVADRSTPAAQAATAAIEMPFADEQSVVQTRFATSALMLLRASLGRPVDRALADVSAVLDEPVPERFTGYEQFTFLGSGWTYGLAQEAALKMREASGAWTEAYPAMEYRHGPMSITAANRLVWMFGPPPTDLAADVVRTGGDFEQSSRDPLADLVRAQRLAVRLAQLRGLDPDRPRNLTRSVILGAAPS
jgi:fructoselysine-6-P-deglycase FrlB-like protein